MMYSSLTGAVGFVPGDAVAIIGDQTVALVDADPRSELVKELWDGVLKGVDFADLVEDLTRDGLRSLPPLALLQVNGNGCRVLVRGAMVVTIRRSSTPVDSVLDGSAVTSWIEHSEAEVEHLEVHLGGDLSEAGAFLVERGVVPACRVVWSVAGPAERPLVDASPPPPVGAQIAGGGVASQESDREPVAADEVPDANASATIQFTTADYAVAPAPPSLPSDEEVPEENPTEAAPDGSLPGTGAVVDPDPVPVASGESNGEADLEAVDDGDEDEDEYDHLFGATQYRSVAGAGVPDPDDDSASEVVPSGVIESVPGSPDKRDSAGAVQDSPPAAGDHDGMTISLAQLRAAAASGAAPSPIAGSSPIGRSSPSDASVMATMVHAVECPSRHLNPPAAATCRICSVEIPQQAHTSVPRPALGVFRFSTGEQRTVTRSMLLGRSPKVDGPVSGELPELVSLPSPSKELSGTHLEVRLEGWQVLVVDRRSTNGTTVQLPGREPQRLHPGEPFPIVPGAVVDMADEVAFTYEVGP